MIVTNLRFLRFSSASSSFSSNRIKLHNVNTSNKPFHSPNYPATIVTPCFPLPSLLLLPTCSAEERGESGRAARLARLERWS